MRYLSVIPAVLCMLGLLAACAPEVVPPLQDAVLYDANGQVSGRAVYTYDENGNRVRSAYFDAAGEPVGYDAYLFTERGLCRGFVRYDAQEQPYMTVTAQQADNHLAVSPDGVVYERSSEGKLVRCIAFDGTGEIFSKEYDAYENCRRYVRYAAGEPYFTYQTDGERYNLVVFESEELLRLYEYDPYGTCRTELEAVLAAGDELSRKEFNADGALVRQVNNGYENGALLYSIEMTVENEKVRSFSVSNGSGKKLLERKINKTDAHFVLALPGTSEAGGDKQIRVTEHFPDTVGVKQLYYSVVTGKQINK